MFLRYVQDDFEEHSWPANLERAVQKLRDALEDYQEHSSTLKSLYDLVSELDSILGVRSTTPTCCPAFTFTLHQI